MVTNLRERVESDLGKTLEGEFGLPVELIGPGVKITTSANDGLPLKGQVMFDYVRQNPDTGQDIIVNNPVVTLRRSSLLKVPKAGEKWLVKIPTSPSTTAPLEDFMIDPDTPPEGGKSLGTIRLYLRKAVQQ